ncbi:MAG TPA: AAA family ATPase [Candidatus Limnocylindrales bacterium]|nr:AAA family ATPase [Candidatus Limnocylindrales bacterium]
MSVPTIAEAPPVGPSADLLGRADEAAAGDRFLEALGSGAGPSALVLSGPAGIGKTAVWRWIVDRARARGLPTLVASPSAAEAEFSFAALADLLRDVSAAVFDRLPEPQQRALRVALLEESAEGAGWALRTVAAGFLGVIRGIADQGPMILAIDDVQWLDPASRTVIEFALRRLEPERVGILLAVRTDEGVPAAEGEILGLGRQVAPGRVASVVVGPLSSAALYQLLLGRLGQRFARPTLVRIAEWSGGNPLFALEVGRAIVAAGGVIDPAAPPPVPRDLGRALADRIGGLSRDERRSLLVAASAIRPTVSGVRDAARRLRWRVRWPDDPALIHERDGLLLFGHPLMAAQSIAIARPEDRRAVQRALAAGAEDPEARARHLALAASEPDATVAAALDDGVVQAGHRGALDAAIELAQLALRLTPLVDAADVARRRRVLGETLLRAGETTRAVPALRLAADEAAGGSERALAQVALAEALVQSGATADARALCQQALDAAEADRAVQARVELAWSRASSDARDGLRHARAALALLEPGPRHLRARALADIASWLSRLGEPVPMELLDEAVALESAAPPARLIEGALASRAWLLLMSDELDRAHAEYESLRRRAASVGDESSLGRILVEMAQIDLRAGRWDELMAHAEEAIRVADRADRAHDRVMAVIQLGALAVARGNGELARRHLAEADAFGVSAGDPMIRAIVAGNRGLLHLIEGDPAAADLEFRAGERHLADAHLGDEALMRYQADRIEALVELGSVAEAARLADSIEARATANGRRRPMAFVARGRGFVAAAQGDLDRALDSFDRSYRTLTELGMRFEAARSLLARGITHRRRREKRLAHQDLVGAAATFEALRAPAWIARTRREQNRIGLRPRAPAELTETERTVARLAAAGRTNVEIASQAFLSPRTVEGVLARAYGKLGIRSRAELGRAMANEDGERRPPSAG